MSCKYIRTGSLRSIICASTATTILLTTMSCHWISRDELPDTWDIEDAERYSACTNISGTYCDQAIEETSKCYTGRKDRVDKCTSSLSRALLGPRAKYLATHVHIEQSDSKELSVTLWKGETLLHEATLRSEQDEFRCISHGIRINWKDTLVIAPPFASVVDYEYGTFERTTDGALIMKRSNNDLWFMWGFIPWLTLIDSQWVKWESYKKGEICKVTKSLENNQAETKPSKNKSVLSAEAEQGKIDSAAVLAVNYDEFAYLETLAENDDMARRSLELIKYGKPYQQVTIAGLTDAEVSRRALEGNPEAYYQLYWNGVGPDPLLWLCRAADLGHNEALHRLGVLYWHGSEGLKQDNVQSYKWYELSAQTGNYDAWKELRRIKGEALTADALAQANALVASWKPGQCERDLKEAIPD